MKGLWHPTVWSASLPPLRFTRVSHFLSVTIQKIGWQSTLLDSTVILLLNIPLVVRLKRFLHLNLLSMSSSMVKLGLVAEDLLGIGRGLVGFTGGTLSPVLILVMVQKPARVLLWQ